MSRDEFIALLDREGFREIVTVEREAHGALGVHTHPHEAKALVLAGEIRIETDDAATTYGVGQVFHLAAGEPHAERYGPAGVRYVVGRR